FRRKEKFLWHRSIRSPWNLHVSSPMRGAVSRRRTSQVIIADQGETEMIRTRTILASMLGASALVVSAPAIAQNAPEEIIVTGEYGKAPDSVQSLSQSVSYADLDLSTQAGRNELRHRVSLTARFLCNKLGESDA